jgi:hypothetical protein
MAIRKIRPGVGGDGEKKRAIPLRPRFAPDGNSGFSGGAGDGSGRDEDFEGGDSSNSCCFRRELTGYVL